MDCLVKEVDWKVLGLLGLVLGLLGLLGLQALLGMQAQVCY
jgi:hypothetical protein